MCDGFGIAPDTFLCCLCVQPHFIEIYGSLGSVGTFVEGAALQEIYSILATIRRWIGTRCVLLTDTFKRITHAGSMVCFPVHKGYFGKPAHHRGASRLKWLLISKMLNPQPVISGQDALGLITIYPRPDEHSDPPQLPAIPDRSRSSSTSLLPVILAGSSRPKGKSLLPRLSYHRNARLSTYSEK